MLKLDQRIEGAAVGHASRSSSMSCQSNGRRNSAGPGLRSRLEALAGELGAEAETRMNSERKVWQAIELEAHERKTLGDEVMTLREMSEAAEERCMGPHKMDSDFSLQLARVREDLNADRAIRAGESVALSRYFQKLQVRLTEQEEEFERRIGDLSASLETEISTRKLLGEETEFKFRSLRNNGCNGHNADELRVFKLSRQMQASLRCDKGTRTYTSTRDSSCTPSKVQSSRDLVSPSGKPAQKGHLDQSDTLTLAITKLPKQRATNANSDFPLQFEDLSRHIQGTYAGTRAKLRRTKINMHTKRQDLPT